MMRGTPIPFTRGGSRSVSQKLIRPRRDCPRRVNTAHHPAQRVKSHRRGVPNTVLMRDLTGSTISTYPCEHTRRIGMLHQSISSVIGSTPDISGWVNLFCHPAHTIMDKFRHMPQRISLSNRVSQLVDLTHGTGTIRCHLRNQFPSGVVLKPAHTPNRIRDTGDFTRRGICIHSCVPHRVNHPNRTRGSVILHTHSCPRWRDYRHRSILGIILNLEYVAHSIKHSGQIPPSVIGKPRDDPCRICH